MTRLSLIGKPGCHLCDDARSVIEAVLSELDDPRIELQELSILDDAALHEKHWEEIPVLLIDDVVHGFWRIDPERLRRALTEEP